MCRLSKAERHNDQESLFTTQYQRASESTIRSQVLHQAELTRSV
jgi:hypothetical protein